VTLFPVCNRENWGTSEHLDSKATPAFWCEQRTDTRKMNSVAHRNTNAASLLQGFPGPQGLVGLPGEKVRRFYSQRSYGHGKPGNWLFPGLEESLKKM